MSVRLRTTALIFSATALLSLVACSAPASTTQPESASGSDPGESTAPVAAPVKACPDGFVEDYAAALASAYQPDLTVTEVAPSDFEPAFLAPFLDGGCAVHVTGVLLGDMALGVDGDYGFAPDATVFGAIEEAFEANGFEADPNFPGGYQSTFRFGGMFAVGGEVTIQAQDAVARHFPGGVTFYA